MNYLQTINQATQLISQLELDEALNLLHKLLIDHPLDLELINRIYQLEIKRPQRKGFEKISLHIFSIQSKSKEYKTLIHQTFGHYLELKKSTPELNQNQLFNLFLQLLGSRFIEQIEDYKNQIKAQYSNHPELPLLLQTYCEHLILQKQLLKTREELKYIIAYYAETDSGAWALKTRKWVEDQLSKTL